MMSGEATAMLKAKPTSDPAVLAERPRPRCAHDVCDEPAIISMRAFDDPRGSWINVCMKHYRYHLSDGATRRLAARGLDTREKQMVYLRSVASRWNSEAMPAPQLKLPLLKEREPGCDDNEP